MRRFCRAWIALLVVALVSGCAVNQKEEVATYRRVLDEGQTQSTKAFRLKEPLTLRQALALANANNESLALSGEDYLQALIDKDRAFDRFLPTIAFVPTYMRQEKTSLGAGNPLVSAFVPDQTLDLPVEGQLNVAPFTDVPALGAAASAVKGKRALLLERRAVVLLDVAQTYYQVLRAESQAKVLAHSVAVQTRRVADIRSRHAAGTARTLDVAQAEAQLAGTRVARIQAENDVKNGRAMLALLMGVPAVDGPLTDGFSVPGVNWPMAPLLQQAMAHREDLRAARARVEAAAKRLQTAWGEYFPSVSLNLTGYLSRESFPSDVDWVGLLQVRIPIFSAGLIHADVRTAYSQLRQAHLAESLVRRRILRDLRSAREDLIDVQRRIDQLKIEVTAAREAMRQADAAYDAGLGTNLERITAQDRLLKAELAETSARFDRNVNYLRLLRVTGGLDTTLALSPVPVKTISSPARAPTSGKTRAALP